MKATQLTAFDASFLALDTNISVGHVTLLSLLDREVSLEELFLQIEARLHLVPMLRRKLRAPSLIVGRPWWIDDPDFDLDQHLRLVHLKKQFEAYEQLPMKKRVSVSTLEEALLLKYPLLITYLIQITYPGFSVQFHYYLIHIFQHTT